MRFHFTNNTTIQTIMNRAGTNFSTRIVGNLRKSPFLQTLPDQQCDRTSLLDRNWFVPGYADYRDSVHGADSLEPVVRPERDQWSYRAAYPVP